ncbi:hypothetical protein N8147_00200 [Flavobacteriaceae bacterium]|nr:hypothetical protein [Flavobacteriaceae bacterium]
MKKYKIYNFEYFDLELIEELYSKGRKYGLGKFLSKLYKRTIVFKDVDEDDGYLLNKGFIYLSKIEIERYLGSGKKNGEFEWYTIIQSLSKRGIIHYRREGNNPYDFNKKMWFFKLNDEFFNCKKTYVDVESKTLIKWLNKQNNISLNKVIGDKENDKKGMDKFLLYELDVCIGTDLSIDDLDLVIEQRISNKLSEYRDKLKWDWLGQKQKKKIVSKLFDEEVFISRYKKLLKQKYNTLKLDLEHLRKGEYFELSSDYFRRDNYGYRIYNIYSRCIREFRDHIKIDGEDTVEIDLKNSMISIFYYFIKLINDENKNSKYHLIKEVYHKLIKHNEGEINDIKLGLFYLERWNYIIEYGEEFNNDYYNFLKKESGYDELSRNSFKELLWLVLFGNEQQLQSLKLKNQNYSEIKHLLLGQSRFLVDDLRQISLYNWNKKNYKKYKNISLILHTLERMIMDRVSEVMIKNNYKYISIFDSFIVKKSEGEEIQKLLNDTVESIDKVFTFRLK